MSPLFSLFLRSHYISFPISILTFFLSFCLFHWSHLIFLSYSPLPSCYHFPLFSPLYHFLCFFCLKPCPSHSTSPFFFLPYSIFCFPLSHLCPHQSAILPVFFFSCFPSISLFLRLLCRVWEVTTGEVLNTLIHHNEAVLHLRFANGLMVTCSKDRSIAVWDMASPTDISLRRVLVGHRAAVNVVDFDDKYIVSASGDRTIKVPKVENFIFRENKISSDINSHLPTDLCLLDRKGIVNFHLGRLK